MDKEKQIEEMARVLCKNQCLACTGATCLALLLCKELYEHGYRKINDNEVVIRKDNYETYKQVLAEWSIMKQENFNFNKPNENEVVISKGEYEELKHFEKRVRSGVCLTQKEWFDFCNEDSNRRTCLRIEEREQARKETAEKILKEFYKRAESSTQYDCFEYYEIREDDLEEIAKQFGVEIGEE